MSMDILDEKANGGPPMEVEEVISVRNRECRSSLSNRVSLLVASLAIRRPVRCATHARHGSRRQRFQSLRLEADKLEKARKEDH